MSCYNPLTLMVFAWPRRKGSAILTCNLAMWRAEYRPATSSMPSLILRRKKELLYTWLHTVSLRKYISQKPFLRGLFLEGHIYKGKFAWQNRLGLYGDGNLRLKIYWASLKLEKKFMSVLCTKFLLKLAVRTYTFLKRKLNIQPHITLLKTQYPVQR